MGNAAWVDQDFAESRARNRRQAVRDELTGGEKVVWEGQPQLRWLFLLSLPAVGLGLAVALGWTIWVGMTNPSRDFLALVGLPFFLGTMGLLLAPVWVVARGVGTVYVITNRRAIVCQPLLIPGMQIQSYGPNSLGRMLRNQRADGSGDLIFEEVGRSQSRGRRFVRRGFLAVADVRRVETLLRETLLNHRSAH